MKNSTRQFWPLLSILSILIALFIFPATSFSRHAEGDTEQHDLYLPLIIQAPTELKILFASNRTGNEDIYIMNMDGTDIVNLTNHPAKEWFHRWSPDGQFITFLTDRDGNDELYRLYPNGSGLKNLTQSPGAEWGYAWSPQAGKIAFLTDRDGNDELYVMAADGTGVVNLSNHSAEERSFAWSPDGSQIAFTSDRDGDDELYVINSDGTGLVQLTHNNAIDEIPRWAPLGTHILFSSNVEKGGIDPRTDNEYRRDTYIVKPDGSALTLLSYDTYLVHTQDAEWFPDGQSVIFSAFWIGASGWPNEGFTVNINATGLTQFTTLDALNDISFRFSPDGSKIALRHHNSDGTAGSGASIYVVNADGTNLILLETNSNHQGYPKWTHDSQQLIFWTAFDVNWDFEQTSGGITLVNADGTGFTQLTINEEVRDHSPRISPPATP